MSGRRDGLARSVQVRLAQYAKVLGTDPNLVLTRYAVERFLYRLSRSPYAGQFVLKGALMLLVWLGETIRPTRLTPFLAPVLDAAYRQVFLAADWQLGGPWKVR